MIKICKTKNDLYVATLLNQDKSVRASLNIPMTAKDLSYKLVHEFGEHQIDVYDAFYLADPQKFSLKK